jgi:hypothetical protein
MTPQPEQPVKEQQQLQQQTQPHEKQQNQKQQTQQHHQKQSQHKQPHQRQQQQQQQSSSSASKVSKDEPRRVSLVVPYTYRPEKAASSWIVEYYQITALLLAGVSLVTRVSRERSALGRCR